MKVYLVGGAVRDAQLGLPVLEKDWVVTGSTPEDMTALGYQPVGQSFPVFLHPKTKEEYALARTEKKVGKGYHGFTFHADASVSLEEDLKRRDLTINAIAEDEYGQLIDPYGGLEDLQNKVLRHVSPAFSEDPVRLLRLARFAARFHHLGFSIADETHALLQSMVKAGEVDHLVSERVWQETLKAFETDSPQIFFECVAAAGALPILFQETQLKTDPLEIPSDVWSPLPLELRMALFVLLWVADPKAAWQAWEKAYPIAQRQAKTVRLFLHAWEDVQQGDFQSPETYLALWKRLDIFRAPERWVLFLTWVDSVTQCVPWLAWSVIRENCLNAYRAVQMVSIQPILEAGHQGAAIQQALDAARLEAIQSCLR